MQQMTSYGAIEIVFFTKFY